MCVEISRIKVLSDNGAQNIQTPNRLPIGFDDRAATLPHSCAKQPAHAIDFGASTALVASHARTDEVPLPDIRCIGSFPMNGGS
jgi:hypothetical protein